MPNKVIWLFTEINLLISAKCYNRKYFLWKYSMQRTNGPVETMSLASLWYALNSSTEYLGLDIKLFGVLAKIRTTSLWSFWSPFHIKSFQNINQIGWTNPFSWTFVSEDHGTYQLIQHKSSHRFLLHWVLLVCSLKIQLW